MSQREEKSKELYDAAENGNIETVRRLLEEGVANINWKNPDEFCSTALHEASENGHTAAVQLLLEKGADINIQDMGGSTALHCASFSGHTAVVQLLLEKGADPNIQNKNGNTALICASEKGHTAVVQLLLEKGADPNIQSQNGATALIWASRNGHTAVVQLLLEKGANPNIQGEDGKTALNVVCKFIVADKSQESAIRRLLRTASAPAARERSVAPASARPQPSAPPMQVRAPAARERSVAPLSALPQPSAPPMQVRTYMEGETVRRADIVRGAVINTGSLSDVWHAQWRGTRVAMKTFRSVGTTTAAGEAALEQEVQILTRLRHPRVLTLLGVCRDLPRDEGVCALLTEYMEGGSLFDILHGSSPSTLSLAKLLRIAVDAADGMRFLHHSDLLHRDLKSANILLDSEGRGKIADFGLSKFKDSASSHVTAVIGTAAWSSPETLRGEEIRRSSDVYSFGVVLWELVTGDVPWAGIDLRQVIGQVGFAGRELEVPSVSGRFPADLRDIVINCLVREQENRPTFDVVYEELHPLLMATIAQERATSAAIPHSFLCPIGHEVMQDPVVCADGHSYERANIEQWFQQSSMSPMTGLRLESTILYPNQTLRTTIADHR